jgi:aerobic-type carbon monoxide dehydrogenase small subunit (CoxS/CutS family)
MMQEEFVVVRLVVNGVERRLGVEPRRRLCDALREDLGLTGTNLGCEQGVCGSCTVLVNGRSARSCLMFAVQANGCEVTTVEGLASDGELHPLQAAFREKQGLQCGFCTPGFLIAGVELLSRNPDPDEAEVRDALAGNTCRCTGYEHIVEAVQAAARRNAGVPLGAEREPEIGSTAGVISKEGS